MRHKHKQIMSVDDAIQLVGITIMALSCLAIGGLAGVSIGQQMTQEDAVRQGYAERTDNLFIWKTKDAVMYDTLSALEAPKWDANNPDLNIQVKPTPAPPNLEPIPLDPRLLPGPEPYEPAPLEPIPPRGGVPPYLQKAPPLAVPDDTPHLQVPE